MGKPFALVVAVLAPLLWHGAARPCSPPEAPPPFAVAEAAPGGLWWFDREGAEIVVGSTIRLGETGGVTLDVEVVSVGMRQMAVRVPADAAVGTRVPLVVEEHGIRGHRDLVVGDGVGADVAGADVRAPDLVVEDREVLSDRRFLFAVPPMLCGNGGPGLYENIYRQAPFAVFDVDDGHFAEVSVRLVSDFAFEEFNNRNEMLVSAATGRVDVRLEAPPPATTEYVAHARFVRLADGSIGPVASVTVDDPDDDEGRVEFVGCGGCSGGGDAALPVSGALLLLLRRRRRR